MHSQHTAYSCIHHPPLNLGLQHFVFNQAINAFTVRILVPKYSQVGFEMVKSGATLAVILRY